MRMAALTVALTLIVSGLALAQYDDDDDDDGGYYRGGSSARAQQYGYQSGYRDGVSRGREEGRENDPFDYRTPGWRQATHGYQRSMGPVSWFQRGYQEGYRNGFQSGYESVNPQRGDDDRDDRYRRVGPFYRGYNSPAYNIGYQDGVRMADHDLDKNNRFDPSPRGPFDDKDHGYRREYGDKSEYKAEYSNGYRTGYEATYGRY